MKQHHHELLSPFSGKTFVKGLLLSLLLSTTNAFSATDTSLEWHDGTTLPLEGKSSQETASPYVRMAAKWQKIVPGPVWAMSHHTTGLHFRFVTDANRFVIRWTTDSAKKSDPFMPPSALTGIDVYGWTKEKGWRFVRNGRLAKTGDAHELDLWWTPGQPCMIYLPLRSVVKSFSIGLPKGKKITAAPPHRIAKPVVHYGTSIVHGGCCSRPGLAFAAIEGRLSDVEIINLGFSGAGKMERCMADVLADVDASLYIVDCKWNLSLPLMKERCEPFLRALHAKRPNVPILLCGGCTISEKPHEMDLFAQALVSRLQKEDPKKWGNLHYLDGVKMLPKDGEATYDFCHPNDYGMMYMGRVYADAIRSILK